MVSTFRSFAASPPPRATLQMAGKVHAESGSTARCCREPFGRFGHAPAPSGARRLGCWPSPGPHRDHPRPRRPSGAAGHAPRISKGENRWAPPLRSGGDTRLRPTGDQHGPMSISQRAGTKAARRRRRRAIARRRGRRRDEHHAANTFSVYAVDAAGNRSASSNTVSFTTAADTTPPSPAPVISVTKLFPTRAVLTWPQPVDDFSTQVYWTFSVNGSVLGYADRLGPPTQTLLALTPETAYTFQVSVRDRDGNAVTGPPLAVTTPAKSDEQAPTARGSGGHARWPGPRAVLERVDRRHRPAGGDPLRRVRRRHARRGRPGHEDDPVVLIDGPAGDRRQGGGHVGQRVRPQQHRHLHRLQSLTPG